jgi:hypothetical protein
MSAPAASREGQSGRTYRVPANGGFLEVPSVTNVLNVLNKGGLAPSAVKITAEQAVKRYAELGDIIKEKGPDAAIAWLKAFHRDEWAAKRDIGTAVHHAIHQELIGVDPDAAWPTDLAGHRRSWQRFLAEKKPKFEMAEATVFSLKPGHAGTLDWLAKINGRRLLGDTKSGGVYLEAVIQTAAYRHSPHILLDDGTVHPMPAVDGTAVLQITDKAYDLIDVRADDEAYRVFLYLLEVWKYQNGPGKTAIGLAS